MREHKSPPDTGELSPIPHISKSQFIRDHLHLTPRETIAKAKAEGITLTKAVVYSTRSEAKKKNANEPGQNPPGVTLAASNDTELRKLILRYGTLAVRALLDEIDGGT